MVDVIVVDDSRIARQVIISILTADPDIRVIASATDGEQAVDMAARLKPDVITMDIVMPRMDGFEAIRLC